MSPPVQEHAQAFQQRVTEQDTLAPQYSNQGLASHRPYEMQSHAHSPPVVRGPVGITACCLRRASAA